MERVTVNRRPPSPSTSPRPTEERGDCAVKILLVSESGVARGPLAKAFLESALSSCCDGRVRVEARASRDYCEGEAAHEAALALAQIEGDAKGGRYAAKVLDLHADALDSDLVLCMDKFTAEDVMKEFSMHELSLAEAREEDLLTARTRLLGDFLGEGEDNQIDDPLYGNLGGAEEAEEVRRCAERIEAACLGLASAIRSSLLVQDSDPASRRRALVSGLRDSHLGALLPPMLKAKP